MFLGYWLGAKSREAKNGNVVRIGCIFVDLMFSITSGGENFQWKWILEGVL